MALRKTALSDLRVNPPRPLLEPSERPIVSPSSSGRPYKKKTIEVTPEADREFEILKAELGKTGIELAAEALNLLFQKYGKPQVG